MVKDLFVRRTMAAEEEDIEVLRRKLREKEKLLEVQNVREIAWDL